MTASDLEIKAEVWCAIIVFLPSHCAQYLRQPIKNATCAKLTEKEMERWWWKNKAILHQHSITSTRARDVMRWRNRHELLRWKKNNNFELFDFLNCYWVQQSRKNIVFLFVSWRIQMRVNLFCYDDDRH